MLTLRIGATSYHVEYLGAGFWRLTKPDGTSYDVTRSSTGEPYCECPDFQYRHKGLDYRGCKHCWALTEHGLLPAIDRAPVKA